MRVHYGNLYGQCPEYEALGNPPWGATTLQITGTLALVTCKSCLARIVNDLDPQFFYQTPCGRVYTTRIDCHPAPG